MEKNLHRKKIFILGILLFMIFTLPVRAKENDEITLYLFYGDGCPHCREEEIFLKQMEKKYDQLQIKMYEVWYNEENAELLKEVQQVFEIKRNGVPTTIIGKNVMTGFGTGTGSKIKRAIEYYQEEEYVDVVKQIIEGTYQEEEVPHDDFESQEKEQDEEMTVEVPVVGNINMKRVSLTTAAVVIGFIDGFNPCAMWVLLFLISALMGMKNKKRMWILGLAFLITSALVYMLIMLSWIQIAMKITTIIWIRNIIAIIALIGAILNLKSFITSKDSGCDIVDEKKRKSIFQKIKKFTGEKSFFLALIGIMGLAVSINLVELACSAGLPLVFSELLVINQVEGMMKFGYTVLYIIFFLLDDLIIFFIAMFTMQVTGISTKYNKYSHLLGGLIMLLIGTLLLIKPEWLMFPFK